LVAEAGASWRLCRVDFDVFDDGMSRAAVTGVKHLMDCGGGS
jgi:hypothetical protein